MVNIFEVSDWLLLNWMNQSEVFKIFFSSGIGRVTDDSVAILKSHIKELVAQLGKSEEDKEKIAEEAYRKAMEIKTEADRKIVDAHSSQMKQVSLIERLKVKYTLQVQDKTFIKK